MIDQRADVLFAKNAIPLALLLFLFDPLILAQSVRHFPQFLATLLILGIPFLLKWRIDDDRVLIAAGILAGIALTANWLGLILLIPVGVIFARSDAPLFSRLERFAFWAALAGVAWTAFWMLGVTADFPQLSPLTNFAATIESVAFLLGYGMSPLTMLGVVLWLALSRVGQSPLKKFEPWALGIAALTVGWDIIFPVPHPSALLPALIVVVFLAVLGWTQLILAWKFPYNLIFWWIFAGGQFFTLLPMVSHLELYANPVLGGTGAAMTRIDFGGDIGLSEAGAWLTENASGATVGTESTALADFFTGEITSSVTAPNLDWVVITRHQQNLETPSPTILRYYAHLMEPAHRVTLAGVDWVWIYRAPAVRQIIELPLGMDTGFLPKPLGFRPNVDAILAGETLAVDVIWLVDATAPLPNSSLSLRPAVAFKTDIIDTHDENEDTIIESLPVFIEAIAPLQRIADGLVISRHALQIPANLPAAEYSLMADGRPIGLIEVE